jgi:hypothetical protein
MGLFLYEFHQMDDCQQLRNHGARIERQLGIHAGQFGSKRGKLGFRNTWPWRYCERDVKLRQREDRGELSGDERVLGFVSVRTADYFVYGTVFLAWIVILAWGIKDLAD